MRFPADTSYEVMKQELDYLAFATAAARINNHVEEADQLLADIKSGIGKRTRNFLAGKPGFEHWVKEE